MTLWTVLALLAFAAALMYASVLAGWRRRIAGNVTMPVGNDREPVRISMIVPARDAASSIVPLLQDLHAQRYPKDLLETIVVDDGSTDGTAALVEGLMRHWPGARLVRSQGNGKKAAITTGVSHATGDLILLTDADARCGAERAASLARAWQHEKPALMLMPVRTVGGPSALGRLQEEEQYALQGATAGSALGGTPALANGANLAFDRKAFLAVGGYAGDRWASGDDMFLLGRMRKARREVRYLLEPAVVVSVQAEMTWTGFIRQRLRWAGKMRAYHDFSGLLAALSTILLPWGLAVLTVQVFLHARIGNGLFHTATVLAAAWCAWLFPTLLLGGAMRRFFSRADPHHGRERCAAAWALIALMAYVVYAPLVALLSLAVRPRWKGRRT